MVRRASGAALRSSALLAHGSRVWSLGAATGGCAFARALCEWGLACSGPASLPAHARANVERLPACSASDLLTVPVPVLWSCLCVLLLGPGLPFHSCVGVAVLRAQMKMNAVLTIMLMCFSSAHANASVDAGFKAMKAEMTRQEVLMKAEMIKQEDQVKAQIIKQERLEAKQEQTAKAQVAKNEQTDKALMAKQEQTAKALRAKQEEHERLLAFQRNQDQQTDQQMAKLQNEMLKKDETIAALTTALKTSREYVLTLERRYGVR